MSLSSGGGSHTVVMTSDAGYTLAYLEIDDQFTYPLVSSYTFSNVQADHSLTAYFSLDSDGDGMSDFWEMQYPVGPPPPNLNPNDDLDSDGLTNLQEYLNGTNPLMPDSDADEMPDKWEVENGVNPSKNDAELDPDNDGFTNLEEYQRNSDPNNPDYIYVGINGNCGDKTPCYSIQEAINASNTGSVIKIAQGTYPESITLNESKSLTLTGGWNLSYDTQTADTTFIQAPAAPQGSLTLQMVTIKP